MSHPTAGPTRGRRPLLGLLAVAGCATLALIGAAVPVADAVPTADGELMSYVVNTRPTPGQTERAERAVEAAGATVVQSWPQIGVVVAHSASTSFVDDVRQGRLGSTIQSVGPTRTAPVNAYETGDGEQQRRLSTRTTSDFEQRQGTSATEVVDADPRESEQWDMSQIGADLAGDGSSDVVVGVLDSGIDDTHPDLAPNVDAAGSVGCTTAGVPDTDRAAWIPTTSDHGTHVAGTIAAARNGIGIVGVAPESTLTSIKVVNDDGFIYPEYAICGFVWAAEHDVDVTNNSYYVDPWQFWCGSDAAQAPALEAVTRAVRYSERQGVVSAAAAGNADYDLADKTTDTASPNDTAPVEREIDDSCADIPTEVDGVVTVASNDIDGLKSSFSNYGEGVIDVTAPGSSILSTTLDGGYGLKSGTSMASPHAAGVLALLEDEHPGASPAQLVRLLSGQADDVACPDDERCTGTEADNSFYGDGLVDALEATGGQRP